MEIMADGDLDDFVAVTHPEAVNREAADEPPACRGRGPAAFYATALWLRAAYADLHWEVHDVVADTDADAGTGVVVVHATMSGRQVGTFVTYDEQGRVKAALPSNGRSFAATQTHWFRLADGLVVEHWANRDDLGQAVQLGWVPPSPRYLVRMALARRRARRES